eukprot:TRINITY_DN2269_c0_g1_i1.p1 TRINITY_DN2269_c0_g1~~TRINITY_DN2269_c0_g1_i1.p1  ORF type:complete len:227 (-),score=5.77 TRINITY_DN2269_c0_g1_i1:309-989(-)
MQQLQNLTRIWSPTSISIPPFRTLSFPVIKINDRAMKFIGTDAHQLTLWLNQNGIDTSAWGHGATKTVEELFEEVQLGESSLQLCELGTALRCVRIAVVEIKNQNGQILTEYKQVLPNGHERFRGLKLSEKLLQDEHWEQGVRRGVLEELGPAISDSQNILQNLTLIPESYQQQYEERVSNSYLGLKSRYECNQITAYLSCIPQSGQFVTQEQRPNGILTTHWRWQ